jgi:hypothetical protein
MGVKDASHLIFALHSIWRAKKGIGDWRSTKAYRHRFILEGGYGGQFLKWFPWVQWLNSSEQNIGRKNKMLLPRLVYKEVITSLSCLHSLIFPACLLWWSQLPCWELPVERLKWQRTEGGLQPTAEEELSPANTHIHELGSGSFPSRELTTTQTDTLIAACE